MYIACNFIYMYLIFIIMIIFLFLENSCCSPSSFLTELENMIWFAQSLVEEDPHRLEQYV